MKESLEFYNQFDKKLIDDYIQGNKRIESAIKQLSFFIPQNSKKAIDIGCGLGWSTHEFSKYIPSCNFEGVDLSPVLIKNASTLFERECLNYKVFDVTSQLPEKKYDAAIMIDVYEHIPKTSRKQFHARLSNLLNKHGRLILACPSKYHQKYLLENDPKGLQPVDEDVDSEVVQNIAKDLKGELIYFEYQSIWRNFDYFYAVIEIDPIYNSNYYIRSSKSLLLEDKNSRINRVNNKLQLNIPLLKKKSSLKLLLKKIGKFN